MQLGPAQTALGSSSVEIPLSDERDQQMPQTVCMELSLQSVHPLGPMSLLDAIVGVGPVSLRLSLALVSVGHKFAIRRLLAHLTPLFLCFTAYIIDQIS